MSSLVSWLYRGVLWSQLVVSLLSLFSPYLWKKRILDLPDNLRIATLTSWRDKERGLAVFAGVS